MREQPTMSRMLYSLLTTHQLTTVAPAALRANALPANATAPYV